MYFLLFIAMGLLVQAGIHYNCRRLIINNGMQSRYAMMEGILTGIVTGILIIAIMYPMYQYTAIAYRADLVNFCRLLITTYVGFQVVSLFCYRYCDLKCRHYLLTVVTGVLAIVTMVVWWFSCS